MTAELRHLRAFVAIADAGTVTRAAAQLHITQPALSRTLAQLEAHLGVRLAERSTHHLELTTAGQQLLRRARAALAAVDDVFDPGRLATWPLRLGHAWSGLGQHTMTLLRHWRAAYPQVPLELLRIDDRTAGLTQGKVDAAVIRDPIALSGVRTVRLFTETRMVALPSNSALADQPTLHLADLAAHPVALNPVSGTTTIELWPEGARPRSTVEVANTDDWLATIGAGRAVGVTTSATADMHPNPAVTYRPLIGAPDVEVHLAWREPPTHPAVADLLAVAVAITSS